MTHRLLSVLICVSLWGVLGSPDAKAQAPGRGEKWVASWAASPHGPYPSGNPSAQPDLSDVFETAADGAVDQTFRLIVKPDLWGKSARLRLSNVFGSRPVTFDDVFVGLQSSGGNVTPGTNRQVRFEGGRTSVTIPAGASAASDAIALTFVKSPSDPLLAGRKLVVSFHVVGASGPMTWHAKALTTSYVTAPRAGSHGDADRQARRASRVARDSAWGCPPALVERYQVDELRRGHAVARFDRKRAEAEGPTRTK